MIHSHDIKVSTSDNGAPLARIDGILADESRTVVDVFECGGALSEIEFARFVAERVFAGAVLTAARQNAECDDAPFAVHITVNGIAPDCLTLTEAIEAAMS